MNSKITILDFSRKVSDLFSFLQETALQGKGAQERWLVFKIASSEHRNGSFQCEATEEAWQLVSMDAYGTCD